MSAARDGEAVWRGNSSSPGRCSPRASAFIFASLSLFTFSHSRSLACSLFLSLSHFLFWAEELGFSAARDRPASAAPFEVNAGAGAVWPRRGMAGSAHDGFCLISDCVAWPLRRRPAGASAVLAFWLPSSSERWRLLHCNTTDRPNGGRLAASYHAAREQSK